MNFEGESKASGCASAHQRVRDRLSTGFPRQFVDNLVPAGPWRVRADHSPQRPQYQRIEDDRNGGIGFIGPARSSSRRPGWPGHPDGGDLGNHSLVRRPHHDRLSSSGRDAPRQTGVGRLTDRTNRGKPLGSLGPQPSSSGWLPSTLREPRIPSFRDRGCVGREFYSLIRFRTSLTFAALPTWGFGH